MKTSVHFLSYLAEFFLEWEIFRTKSVQKIRMRNISDKKCTENQNEKYFGQKVYRKSEWEIFRTKSVQKIRMRNISDKKCTENQKTHFIFNTFFLRNLAFYEIMWENNVESGRPQITVWRMRIACWIPTATHAHIQNMQYLLLLHCNGDCRKRASLSGYTYIACLVWLLLFFFFL